uniref:Uncharacterized protein n=1 Tax=Arundo donax TaxID=35708 RepID=A0A0A9DG38_ARUDO
MRSSHRSSMRSMMAAACSGVAREARMATQLPSANHRKSIRAGLTLPTKYPPRVGMKSKSQSEMDSGLTLNLFTAVWEYSSVLNR